jgi:hypothetical protein
VAAVTNAYLAVLQVTDCNGQTSTAEAAMVFEQPIVARADTFSYSTSPLTVVAVNGLLNNDAVPPSCAGSAPTFAVATPPTSGTVVVSQASLAQSCHFGCTCAAAQRTSDGATPALSTRTAVVACVA